MIEIKEYNDIYANEMSNIIIQNLLEINSKDYGLEYVQNSAKEFTPNEITKNFPKRTKVFVALENGIVVGTAGIDKSWYNDDGEFWILTVFVDIKHHKQGIGKLLIKEIEKFALTIPAKKLVIPASIYAAEFYHKLGYEYANGKKELNEHQMYIMEKILWNIALPPPVWRGLFLYFTSSTFTIFSSNNSGLLKYLLNIFTEFAK